jgi:hypothetical protein
MECLKSVGENKNVVMDAPYFYQKLSEALGNYTADYWVPYMRLHVIYNLSPLLNGKLMLTCTVREYATLLLSSLLRGQHTPVMACLLAQIQHVFVAWTSSLYGCSSGIRNPKTPCINYQTKYVWFLPEI